MQTVSSRARGPVERLSAVAFLAMAIACSPTSASQSMPISSDRSLRAEVDSLSGAMMAAFDSSPARVARFYADSARIVGPRRHTVAGRQAIDRYWASMGSTSKWTLEVVDVGGSRNEVHHVGISRLSSTRSDGTPSTYVCDFVVLWKRQPDGTMRIMLDLYN